MSLRDVAGLQRRYAGEAGRLVREFYVPVISQATRYDRQAGFFDSATLVQLAAGLARFIRRAAETLANMSARPAPMRLVTGATWNEDDIHAFQRGLDELSESLSQSLARHFEPSDDECLRLGLPPGWRPEEDQIARHRLGTLAWMVSRGLLEVRVALPLDHLGRPYQPGRHGALYHPKAGILYDGDCNIVSFQGSVNETGAAWARNREKFEVKRSWYSQQDAEDIEAEIEEFERIWAGRDPGLLVVPLPNAVERRLVSFAPTEAPAEDPLDVGQVAEVLPDRIAAQFLLDAPRMPGGESLTLSPLLLDPYPHQSKVAKRVLEEFPRHFLFCDEVGLGKTIEAGIAMRRLILAGEVSRVLLIVPRSLVRQWQEELREKFALTGWFYNGQCLIDVGGRTRDCYGAPWEQDGIVIVSRHYAARQARQEEILGTRRPWDLVLVDEAHAARRKVFDQNEPNLLLTLLQEAKRHGLFHCLWLFTATPMQLDPVEVHDLLRLCGVEDPPWGEWASADWFEGFFLALRRFATEATVRPQTIEMATLAVDLGAKAFSPAAVPEAWDQFRWRLFAERVNGRRPGLALALSQLTGHQAEALVPLLARQTPLAVHMFRYTRATLRAYQEQGFISSPVPFRDPKDVPVTFVDGRERQLYERIDELCGRFYRLADLPPSERSGIGFLMAVFRKRLASSFAAFRKSLERRRDFILQAQREEMDEQLRRAMLAEVAEEEDEDGGAADNYVETELLRLRSLRRDQLATELGYIRDYIADLAQIDRDSKFAAFEGRLGELLEAGHRVIVFTQYLDTMDFIRDQLVARFADRVVCYSGRGGEVWDPLANNWRVVDKSEVKARSRKEHSRSARILIGTDAASEGLNLQQFSALINYDLPWNPMRIEQRIGRIDRIGQEVRRVTVVNLYLDGSIEQDTYNVLRDRIGFFEEVVGPLQPILAEVPRILRRFAQGEMEREEVRQELELIARREPRVPIERLENCVQVDSGSATISVTPPAPATQRQLAAWCLLHPAPNISLAVCPEPGTSTIDPDGTRGCISLTWADAPPALGLTSTDRTLVTFNPEVADRHPSTAPEEGESGELHPGREGVRLLTWGDPLLQAWLEAVRAEPLVTDELECLGYRRTLEPVGYQRLVDSGCEPITFGRLLEETRARQNLNVQFFNWPAR